MQMLVSRAARRAIILTGGGIFALCASSPEVRADDDGQGVLKPNSLIISSSTYDRSQGAVAKLTVASLSGDNGADPNKVVVITDKLRATTITDAAVASESFKVVAGPTL